MRGYLHEPPLIKTDLLPKDLMGGYEELYKTYFESFMKSLDAPEKASKPFSQQDMDIIADINAKLSKHGFVPSHVDAYGNLRFYIVTTPKDAPRLEVEDNPGPALSPEESKRRLYQMKADLQGWQERARIPKEEAPQEQEAPF